MILPCKEALIYFLLITKSIQFDKEDKINLTNKQNKQNLSQVYLLEITTINTFINRAIHFSMHIYNWQYSA